MTTKRVSPRAAFLLLSILGVCWFFYYLFGASLPYAQKATGIWLVKASIYVLAACLFFVIPAQLKLISLSVLLSFSILEIGLYGQSIYLDYKFPEDKARTGIFEYDPILGWKNRANHESYYTSKKDGYRNKIKINSKGLRDKEYPYEKKEGISRILLVGDSVIAGFEVDKKDLLDVQLEALLKKDGNYEVLNGGVQGYGTDQSYLFLKNEGYKYTPDIVIYVAVDNDPTENISVHQRQRAFGKPYFVIDENDQLTLKGVPPPTFKVKDDWVTSLPLADEYYNWRKGKEEADQEELSVLRSIKQDFSHLHFYQWLKSRVTQNNQLSGALVKAGLKLPESEGIPEPEAIKDYKHRITKKLFGATRDFSNSIGAKFLVYEFTNGVGKKPADPSEVKNICLDFGIKYLNSFDEFYEISSGKKTFYFLSDGHWNNKGHQLAAEGIYRNLKELGWI